MVLRKLFSNLAFQVILAIVCGVLLGHFYPSAGVKMDILGRTFIDIIKLFIGPIIFCTIVLGMSSVGDMKKVGRLGLKAIVYFEIVTTAALVLGIVIALIAEPGKIDMTGLAAQDASKFTQSPQKEFSWWAFFKSNFTLQVLAAAMICGVVLNRLPRRDFFVQRLSQFSLLVFKALRWVMYLAPIGAFGGISYAVGNFGLQTLVPLGKLMLSVYATMGIFVFVVLGAIMRYMKLSIFSFLKYIKEELLLVFATSSSESALPSIMEKLQKMGCSKAVVGLVVPTGYSFNLDGTSIYLSMSVLFIAQLYGVHVTLGELAGILGILMITSKGAAGVTGSGFIVLASTLTAFPKIPIEGLAFLLGIDKFLSEARAITNIIGNAVATVVIAKSEDEFFPNEHTPS
ncbi:dicarboxylate/amino acid:cation symporter [Ravibacter arvi]|uniref:Dicarboxylate/amino acid:cation symporter n=1 Tax=Ravibacter arvi TaxID=2051041 RepID=A0ABP8M7A9_9BACT